MWSKFCIYLHINACDQCNQFFFIFGKKVGFWRVQVREGAINIAPYRNDEIDCLLSLGYKKYGLYGQAAFGRLIP